MIEDSPSARQWNAPYVSSEYVFGREPSAFLVREAHRLPRAGRILCVADGEGRNGVWLARQGFDVHALDISEVGLAKAQLLAAEAEVPVHFELADVLNWPWPVAAYDAVVAIFIQFAAPADRTKLFSSMKHALRPGGLLLLHGYRPEQVALGTGGPPLVENMYDELLLRRDFGDMDIDYLHTYDADLQEGLGHRGPSALIDLVACKPL